MEAKSFAQNRVLTPEPDAIALGNFQWKPVEGKRPRNQALTSSVIHSIQIP